jgi:BirA family transcriptional regulator, biotin operon repressor / biotin---[acetyl-CoA-carboxylase] ligase
VADELPTPASIEEKPGPIFRRVLRFDAVDSTNEVAKLLLGHGADEGTVVVAKRQSAGRGRHGRAWASPPGGLYVSLVVRPEPTHVATLGLLAGIPVVKALRHVGVFASLKWPNDVVFMEKKIGGILSEGVYRGDAFYGIIGVGVNTGVDLDRLPEDVRARATSVKREVAEYVDNDDFLEYMMKHFEDIVSKFRTGTRDRLVKDYRGLCTTIGKDVVVTTPRGTIAGRAYDITPLGALVVMDARGAKTEVVDGTVEKAG